ncbi:MAG: prolyl oligopeptidase family serine peptidase, partial [Bryobacter sp.]|nr:prolyl oligopeptidase family serine peptidase [Bryobacter sp.]
LTPPGAMVLHLYGRYCNANKFAGEVDLFEALDDVKRHYRVDENRIVVRGFSMGGAATWHIAAHHAGLWAAAAPGAGFAETPLYLGLGKKEPMPAAWEQTLWRWYDAPFYAANLRNLPVVAYSGEKDRQKQAADVMAEAMAREGVTLRHVIGPDTEHRYHPQSKIEIEAAISALAEAGRDPYPRRLTFATHTLRYDRMKWIRIDALDKHWEEARVEASIADDGTVSLTTKNVAALTLEFGPAGWPFAPGVAAKLRINGQPVAAPPVLSDRSWRASLRREGAAWRPFDGKWSGLRKVHGLTGPIDDALMDRFVFVRPTGPNPSAWALAEMERAAREWRRQMKGEPRIKNDTEITEADIREANLVLWGEPSSNQVLGRIAGELPIAWSSLGGGESLVMIYPNPLNPKRYVVLNSGLTWREPDYLSNARQTPKLPDWAVVDTGTAAVRRAGFFDEQWRYTEKH